MNRFVLATRAELAKVTTTRTWWLLALVMVVYLGFTGALLGGVFGLNLGEEGSGLEGTSLALTVYTTASSIGFVFPVLMGALAVTGEYRHRTIIPTMLTVASRKLSLGAKLAAQFIFGLIFGIMAYATTILASVFFLMAGDLDTGLGSVDTWSVILRGVLVMATWALIGVGVGCLIPNQAAVLVVVIGFTQFLEPILRLVSNINQTFGIVGKFLPGSVSDAFSGVSSYSLMGGTSGGGSSILEWWIAGLVLLTYIVASVGAGYLVRWSRDLK